MLVKLWFAKIVDTNGKISINLAWKKVDDYGSYITRSTEANAKEL